MLVKSAKGFTIVELLIVIVVIAILAAITIVAFNGVQQRASSSAASAAASQAKRKLVAYKTENDAFPLTGNLSSADIRDAQGTTYDYSSNGETFCLTATSGKASQQVSDASDVSSGGCPGHSQGGVVAVTNLMTNPSMETSISGWSAWRGNGTQTTSRVSSGGKYGSSFGRYSWTTGPTTGYVAYTPGSFAVAAGEVYTVSVDMRQSSARNVRAAVFFFNSSGGEVSNASTAYSPVPSDAWQRISVSGTAPANAVTAHVRLQQSSFPATGETFDMDGIMAVKGTYNLYNDGDSTDWTWNGTAHSSTSTGPAR